MGLFDTLFGSKAQAGTVQAAAQAKAAADIQTPEAARQAAAGAAERGQAYDTATAADTAGGAAATMKRAQEAARAGAASQSDQAVAQAAKAARTGGMMPGQAALAGSAQAAGAYGTGMQQGVEQFGQNVTRQAQLGESMSGRLQNLGQTQTNVAMQNQAQANQMAMANANAQNQIAMANAANQTQASGANAAKPGLFGQIAGAAAGIGSVLSDRRLKDDIKESGSLSDSLAKLKGYSYRYKGSERPERGIMAQDVEKTKAAPAVIDTPAGKAIDARRLTTINTAAIGEQGRRIRDIEKMLKGFREVK